MGRGDGASRAKSGWDRFRSQKMCFPSSKTFGFGFVEKIDSKERKSMKWCSQPGCKVHTLRIWFEENRFHTFSRVFQAFLFALKPFSLVQAALS